MKVNLIAHTQLNWLGGWGAMMDAGYSPHAYFEAPADELAEFSGRLCYEAWNRPNPATATNQSYVANILDHKHFSVLEHASATFLIEGVSRSLTHELVRHRHFSFSQVSQRYVSHADRAVVKPPAMNEAEWYEVSVIRERSLEAYKNIVANMRARGIDKKTANGAARAVLPEATSTSLVMTGNHRSWREFVDKRYSKYADVEIRNLAGQILAQLKKVAPNIYQDLEVKDDFEANPVR